MQPLSSHRGPRRGALKAALPERRGRGDKGVALVEFAIIMPLLFLLIFGIIEFGWAFRQNLDVRHGAREGIRLAAVNANPSNGESTQQARIAREICNRMDADTGPPVQVQIDVNGSLVADGAGDATIFDIGDEVTVTITKDLQQLTNFLAFALNGVTLDSTVKTRLEQPATYADLTATDNFTC
ncbi:MAG: TadE/TadG family type IV pilus assembly protein [Actinomycetota bacterium]